jgi:putative ABC transport system permease protein
LERRNFLVQARTSQHAVARRIAGLEGTSTKVSDIDTQRRVIGSNLTAVELGGLALGAVAAALMAGMLIKILTGVVDPPPAPPRCLSATSG